MKGSSSELKVEPLAAALPQSGAGGTPRSKEAALFCL